MDAPEYVAGTGFYREGNRVRKDWRNRSAVHPLRMIGMLAGKFHVMGAVHLDEVQFRLADRAPFLLSRLLPITEEGKVLYKAGKEHCQEYPEVGSEDLQRGAARNCQVIEPLDFLVEFTQYIPNRGEHLLLRLNITPSRRRTRGPTTSAHNTHRRIIADQPSHEAYPPMPLHKSTTTHVKINHPRSIFDRSIF